MVKKKKVKVIGLFSSKVGQKSKVKVTRSNFWVQQKGLSRVIHIHMFIPIGSKVNAKVKLFSKVGQNFI